MRVMVTGGTGFIGGHLVAALIAEGHEPHLLVRDVEKLQCLCELHQLDPSSLSYTVGDMLDEASVREALEGCRACVHAAAFTSLDPAEMPKALGINAPGARIVLDSALSLGCDPVVHLSSISAIFPPIGDVLSGQDPVEEGGEPYAASKAESELYARGLQGGGHPVVIVYPGAVLGPRDLGVNVLESMMPAILGAPVAIRAPHGGWVMLDVRDLATAVARVLTPGQGPRRFVAAGNFLGWDEFAAVAEDVTGNSRPVVDVTEEELIPLFGEEAARLMVGVRPGDDAPLQEETGVTWRPFSETLTDLLAWMDERAKSPT